MEKKLSGLGIDMAQQVLHLVGMDEQGTMLVRQRLYRAEVLSTAHVGLNLAKPKNSAR